MPWFAVNELKPYVPAFADKTNHNVKKAIQMGANRLLSMQTADGGLAYWPGGTRSEDWATTYGGYALILAKENGASVPNEAIEGIANYLATNISVLIAKGDAWSLETGARALHSLSIIGKAKQSDLNYLFERRQKLNMTSRCYLAMAMHNIDPANKDALKLLEEQIVEEEQKHWMRYSTAHQSKLLAYCQIAPQNEQTHQLMDQIVKSTDKRDHWGNTWANSSTINAMAAYAKIIKLAPKTSSVTIVINGEKQTVMLDSSKPMQTITVPLEQGIKVFGSGNALSYCNTVVYCKPLLSKATATSKNGVAIKKTYYRILKDGSRELLKNPIVGDLVEVELDVTFGSKLNYVVIDDPLPGTFECVNSAFKSQSTHVQGSADRNWRVSNQELRDDRALFFLNRSWSGRTEKLSYLARITSSGQVTVPAAKVEAMYDPETYGLSGSGVMHCQPR